MTQEAGRGREWFRLGQDPKLVQEWLRQNNLAYGGLIAVGVALVQPLMTAGALDLRVLAHLLDRWGGHVGRRAPGCGHLQSPPDPGDPGDPGIPES